LSAEPLLIVLIGPGGVGKGTIASALVAKDQRLWLSRSWTTRAKRPSEDGSEYVFVDRATFEDAIAKNAFLEWAEFHGNLYGTPRPDPGADHDVLLEIEVQGATQVKLAAPHAIVFLIMPPSMAELEVRLRQRGDSDEHVATRLGSTPAELTVGKELATHVVVNDNVDRVVEEILATLESLR
jgi:guanylate kinase